jgi:hypothetical protein
VGVDEGVFVLVIVVESVGDRVGLTVNEAVAVEFVISTVATCVEVSKDWQVRVKGDMAIEDVEIAVTDITLSTGDIRLLHPQNRNIVS